MPKPNASNMLVLLLTASVAAGAGGASSSAFASSDPPGLITVVAAQYSEALERRVDKALANTDATLNQKIRIVEILEKALLDMKPLHERRVESDRAMREAMEVAILNPARIEQLRQDRMRVLDAQSKRLTQALEGVAAMLDAGQRQAFFRNWRERPLGSPKDP